MGEEPGEVLPIETSAEEEEEVIFVGMITGRSEMEDEEMQQEMVGAGQLIVRPESGGSEEGNTGGALTIGNNWFPEMIPSAMEEIDEVQNRLLRVEMGRRIMNQQVQFLGMGVMGQGELFSNSRLSRSNTWCWKI